jgi:hypothetical protein
VAAVPAVTTTTTTTTMAGTAVTEKGPANATGEKERTQVALADLSVE